MTPITYHNADIDGLKVFYRRAGHPGALETHAEEIGTAIRKFLPHQQL